MRDLARHNAWATDQVLACCRGLDEPTLNATVPGTYGTISATLRHLLRAEASYLYRLTGAWPEHPWPGDEAVGLGVLAARASTLASVWERFIAQAFHHASEHRAQICTILGALGHEPPDVSAWGYAEATGRMTLKPATTDG